MTERLYWIWLSLALGAGSPNFKKLIDDYSSPKAIYDLSEEELSSVYHKRTKEFDALINKDLSRAEEILEFCNRKSVGILTYADKSYPVLLREISDPPVLLYYRGTLPDFSKRGFVSIVGTRRLSAYGRQNAFNISYELARSGAVIVSGMAIGVDGVSHAGALAANGTTVAVLGSGIDVCYPSAHLVLARSIVKSGCVITEYAPGTKPDRHNFPKRNRIISAISQATVVIEGQENSGALITARYAKKQGRRVYALPANVGSPAGVAANMLIRDGAKLLMSANDVVLDFDGFMPGALNPFVVEKPRGLDMMQAVSEFKVSCVTPSDNIFIPPKPKKVDKPRAEDITDKIEVPISPITEAEKRDEAKVLEAIQDEGLQLLYKKIPAEGSCTVESLADNVHPLITVMNGILALELRGLAMLLPGDRVKRL